MTNDELMDALAKLPPPDLVTPGKISDPIGSNIYYSARTVVQLLGLVSPS
jgi:hypothetical protein